MTIAACYFSPEAVIFGADSTTTMFSPSGPHSRLIRHFNQAQKLFAVGDAGATLGVVTWGIAQVSNVSHRTLINSLDRELCSRPIASVQEAASALSQMVWPLYVSTYSSQIAVARGLAAIPKRSPADEAMLQQLQNFLTLGYSLGGTWSADNTPRAYEILFEPTLPAAPVPQELTSGHFKFWGCPNMVDRVLYGIDGSLLESIKTSPHWTGTPGDLDNLVSATVLTPPDHVPVREAVDFVHASIYTTIRAFKFSQLPMVCGGPIEIAVITSDRPFRWVRHKTLDGAIL